MATLELVLFLVLAVLVSSVISQLLPKIPTSLVQIAMGFVIALFASSRISITLDPELFLVLFIAPLLYDETREANLGDLWHYRTAVLTYAIGLVLAIVLIVGFALHALMPSLPLAAAFALGAALGPTDAVAVSAVSKQTTVSTRNLAILKGESLLNDASGLVSFQFAIAAVVTGGFSLVDASVEFVVMFFGGILLGLICGVVINAVIDWVRDAGLQDTTFHVMVEVCVPFLVYLLAERVGVSGIIAVVACGIINVVTPRTNGVALSRASIVSSSVWSVLSFVLNGIVFVLLGTQLPGAMTSAWEAYSLTPGWLIGIVLITTVALTLVRLLFSLVVERISNHHRGQRFTRENLRSALCLTLSGAKGAVTLSIMFTLPLTVTDSMGITTDFPYRDLLIFIACGVILTTLLLATFVVPLIAPKKVVQESEQQVRARDVETFIDILRTVVEELTDRQTKETARATGQVVAAYSDRIGRMKEDNGLDDADEGLNAVRLLCVEWEQSYLQQQMDAGVIPEDAGYDLMVRLSNREEVLRHGGLFARVKGRLARALRYGRRLTYRVKHKLPFVEPSDQSQQVRRAQMMLYTYVIDQLTAGIADINHSAEDVAAVLLEYTRLRGQLQMTMPSLTSIARTSVKADDVELLALRLELKFINQAADEGKLSRPYAKRARENVYLMQLDLEDRI